MQLRCNGYLLLCMVIFCCSLPCKPFLIDYQWVLLVFLLFQTKIYWHPWSLQSSLCPVERLVVVALYSGCNPIIGVSSERSVGVSWGLERTLALKQYRVASTVIF
jgi:hypothetical protein